MVEAVVGFTSGSLALVADAGHNFSDVLALGLALGAVRLAGRPATGNRSFGYKRAEILAALANALTVAAIVAAVTALLLAVTGTVALAANNLRDGNGYFNSPTDTFTSSGYAIAMKGIDISHAPQWGLNAGLDSVRVKAHGNRALFIGIARSAELEQYLRGTEHDDVDPEADQGDRAGGDAGADGDRELDQMPGVAAPGEQLRAAFERCPFLWLAQREVPA